MAETTSNNKMSPELKAQLKNQYDEMYPKTDWVEIIGSIIAVAGIAVFGYLWFRYL